MLASTERMRPRLASLLVATRASRLTKLASTLESRYGTAADGAANRREMLIQRVAHKLAENGGDLTQLNEKEKRAALDAFWRREIWPAQTADVDNWLRWAEAEWRPSIAETRICTAMLRNYDAQNPLTPCFELWLSTRQDRLWGRFGDFARRWRLAAGAAAAESAAKSLASDDMSFLKGCAQSVQTRSALQASGFLVAAIASYVRRASRQTDVSWKAARGLVDLLGPGGFAGAGGPRAMREATRNAMVCGLIEWAVRVGTGPVRCEAVELSCRLVGDPRISLEHWREIPADDLALVEKWLVEGTLAAAFQIVRQLETDDARMLRRRQDFWSAYLPFITRARVIGAQKAQKLSVEMGVPCRALKTYLSDHCGFLLELQGKSGRRLRVVELNNLAQTMFWPDGHPNAPDFDQPALDGGAMRAKCDALFSHLPADTWEADFAERIAAEIGAT